MLSAIKPPVTPPDDGSGYDATSLQVLEGLDAVRKRPGMYIGTTGSGGLQHCVWEIVDNAVDEALAGYCTNIKVILHEDGSVEVHDDGRGIPTDIEPKTGLSGVEVVFTKLHAGGKFGGGGYAVSGGLHGVGASVVNALSQRVDVEVSRQGVTYSLSFQKGIPGHFDEGKFTKGPIKAVGKCSPAKTGTIVRFWPDHTIFLKEATVDFGETLKRARQTAFLVPGLSVEVIDLRPDEIQKRKHAAKEAGLLEPPSAVTLRFDGGVKDFVDFLQSNKKNEDNKPDPVKPVIVTQLAVGDGEYSESVPVLVDGMMVTQEVARSCHVEVGYAWGNDYETRVSSFVNVIATPKGGTHVQGFERALVKTMNEVMRAAKVLKPADENIIKDDILEGLTAVVLVRISEPQFEGQTKEILGTTAVAAIVQQVVSDSLRAYFSRPKAKAPEAHLAMEKVMNAAKARLTAKSHRDTVRRKNAIESSSMPAKLTDCRSRDASESELFIIEGDSAGGTVKAARDSRIQALLPIRGKILNTMRASEKQMLDNAECKAIITAMGASSGKTFSLDDVRYGKLIILADADVDGSHIRCLLLTLVYRYMRPLLTHGMVYAAVPPLYGLKLSGGAKSEENVVYAYSDGERDLLTAQLNKEGKKIHDVQRYKGLGEMDAAQLADTTLNVNRRKLRRMTMTDAESAANMFEVLMGQEASARREFISERGALLDPDDIDA